MKSRRKFSIFISSTYEDLKEERQALVGVALENNFIPVGMEQFHAAPALYLDCSFPIRRGDILFSSVTVIPNLV